MRLASQFALSLVLLAVAATEARASPGCDCAYERSPEPDATDNTPPTYDSLTVITDPDETFYLCDTAWIFGIQPYGFDDDSTAVEDLALRVYVWGPGEDDAVASTTAYLTDHGDYLFGCPLEEATTPGCVPTVSNAGPGVFDAVITVVDASGNESEPTNFLDFEFTQVEGAGIYGCQGAPAPAWVGLVSLLALIGRRRWNRGRRARGPYSARDRVDR